MSKARQALIREVSILEIIKLHRFLKLAMSNILPRSTLMDFRKRIRTRVIELESDDNNGIDITPEPL